MDSNKFDKPDEDYVSLLKRLRWWLNKNPANNPIVTQEVEALDWVLDKIGENE